MNKNVFLTIVGAGLAIVLIGGLWVNGMADRHDHQTTLESIKEKGVVRVGFANEAPYAYMDTQTGKLTGEAPEIARTVLKQMGVNEVQGVLTEFGSLIPGLKAGRFDIIAAGMYITPKRCEQVNFSIPSYTIGEGFIVKKGNPLDLHGYADIAQHPSAKIGVVVGTVERGYAQKMNIPDDRIIIFPDTPSAMDGVAIGRVDAYAGTDLTIRRLIETAANDNLEQAHPFDDPVINGKVARGYGAFVFRKKDNAFLEAFNSHLRQFIGSEQHLKLVKPFDFTEKNLPGDVSVDELCTGQ